MPGWPTFPSVGFHSDDGKLFTENNEGQEFGQPCNTGDTMGCGVLFSSTGDAETAFFTRNGVLFGWVPLPAQPGGSAPLVYPIVGSLGGAAVAIDLEASFAARPACTLFAASGSKTAYSNLTMALGKVASDQDVVRLEKGVHAFATSVSVVRGVTIATAETDAADGVKGVARVESAEPPTPALSFTSSTRTVGKKKVEASSSSSSSSSSALISFQVLEGP